MRFTAERRSLAISPYEVFRGAVSVSDEIMKSRQNSMGALRFTRKAIRVVFRVDWTDDLEEEGTVGPKYWYATHEDRELDQVIAQENIERIFPQAG